MRESTVTAPPAAGRLVLRWSPATGPDGRTRMVARWTVADQPVPLAPHAA